MAPALDIRPLSGAIGAEIRGVDLKRPLHPETYGEIRAAWLRYKVVFFPGQHLSPDEHRSFAAQFGELTPAHPVIPGIDGYPEVFEIDYGRARELYASYGDLTRRRSSAVSWHTDVTFVQRPPAGSVLNAVVIPPSGGDTLWTNQVAAFEALSPAFQEFLSTLTAVHDGGAQFSELLRHRNDNVDADTGEGGAEWDGEAYAALTPVEHPVVRTHPETGERSLFVNAGFTSHIAGLEPAESQALLGSSISTRRAPSSPCATTGPPATSASGTTERRSTLSSVTSVTKPGSSSVSPSEAMSPSEAGRVPVDQPSDRYAVGSPATRLARAAVDRTGRLTDERHALDASRLVAVVVDRVVLRGLVVPDHDIAGAIPPADRVLGAGHVGLERADQIGRFLRRHALDPTGEPAEQQRAATGHGMDAHQRMPRREAARVERRRVRAAGTRHAAVVGGVRVLDPQPVSERAQVLGELVVGGSRCSPTSCRHRRGG